MVSIVRLPWHSLPVPLKMVQHIYPYLSLTWKGNLPPNKSMHYDSCGTYFPGIVEHLKNQFDRINNVRCCVKPIFKNHSTYDIMTNWFIKHFPITRMQNIASKNNECQYIIALSSSPEAPIAWSMLNWTIFDHRYECPITCSIKETPLVIWNSTL